MKTAIVIPARYGSTRFPGKPLALINGRSMLSLVVDVAKTAAKNFKDVSVFVTTEDQRIADHCAEIGAECIMTSVDCATGSDRVLEAIKKLKQKFDFIINLQGDAPFTPPEIITPLIALFLNNPKLEVITPAHQLRWEDLDALRERKKETPLSGTTCIRGTDGFALWFSKNIIPSIRDEKKLRATDEKSPVWLHMGIYGYKPETLEKFTNLKQGRFEVYEGLEQLRFLENKIPVYVADVHAPLAKIHSGIDSPEDLERVQKS
ncbi:MAG: 3-deoxy-manno-octulosonate cytidylyltransferase [Alphaproteobacteria bacterium]